MIHGGKKSLETLLEVGWWKLINEVFCFYSTLVIRGKKNLNHRLQLNIHKNGG